MSEAFEVIPPVMSIGEMPPGCFWAGPHAFPDARNDEERAFMARLAMNALSAMPVPGFNEWLPISRLMC
jgi:hypothetical protein